MKSESHVKPYSSTTIAKHATEIEDSASDDGASQSYQGGTLIEASNFELLSLENNLYFEVEYCQLNFHFFIMTLSRVPFRTL